jgi:hypothetical protein
MPDWRGYLLPLRYDHVERIALVETGPGHLIQPIVERLHGLFPGAVVEVLLREEDEAIGRELGGVPFQVVRYEERADLVRDLRGRAYDLVVLQVGRGGSQGLRSLPFTLRGRTLVAFNDHLDHFPINVFRLGDVLRHFFVDSGVPGLLLEPLLFGYLLVSTSWIHLRGAARRLARRRRGLGAEV